MIEQVKFKHLVSIVEEKPDTASIMVDVFGYKNNWIGKKLFFKRKFTESHNLIKELEQMDPTKIGLQVGCKIKKPNNIDSISFRAMMEIQALLSKQSKQSPIELITELVCIACYSENNNGPYDSNTSRYKLFRKRILQSPMLDILGLYNWIDTALEQSRLTWEERFFSVEVEDKDYEQAGGQRMSQFNVITTISNLCNDFNCTYDEAWQMPYALTQTNSYAKATAAHIQDNMRQIKEEKMKRDRAQK